MKQIKVVILVLMMLFCVNGSLSAQQIKKENLSVLYVGYDPALPLDEESIKNPALTGGYSVERFKEDFKTRYTVFQTYLKEYFTNVKAVDARSYTPDMSASYDVTIFDQTIKPFEKAVRSEEQKPSKYLKEDFDFPAVFIGHTAPVMGESIGLKLDWLCLCLDADAHHIKTEHQIFKGPFPVKLTMVTRPTPEGIFHYPSGKNVPKEIPMWRVQKETFEDAKGYRVGMVSRGEGFTDSPDAEYISSGVNTKDVDAVAIGRHGNFFMWGFSASPDIMTDEAKQVFANAVVYMKKFKGQKVIARKYNQYIAVRSAYVDDMVARLTKEAFGEWNDYMRSLNEMIKAETKKIQAKKDRGEKLSEAEAQSLEFQMQELPILTWEQYLKRTAMNLFKPEYVDHVDKLIKYLKDNKNYLYSGVEDFYQLKLDEDSKKLGIANNDKKLLQQCIALLKSGKETELANRVLTRYTGLEKNPQEWEKWFNDNSAKLFFTEAGGYKWLIDTTK